MKDNIHTDKKKLIRGINKAAKIIRPTYGFAGSNVIVEHNLYPFHVLTNDGKTIIDATKLADPVEQIAVNILKEASDKTDKDSGDGRKTTMILVDALLQSTKRHTRNPMDIKRSLDKDLKKILAEIDKQTVEISPDQVSSVASVAAESPEIGNLIQEAYLKVGKDGIVELDHSNIADTYFQIKDGVRLRNVGYMAPYMVNSGESATYSKPHILITKQKISTINDVDPLFQVLEKNNVHEIVIYCEDIDLQVLSALANTHNRGIFKTLIIKAPILWKDWIYEDFAKITGATIVDSSTGVSLASAGMEHLGTCAKITATKNETTVFPNKDYSDHVEALSKLGTDESKLRVSWLNTKAAVLKLGANSESELSYVSKKARDGRNAAFQALKGGVVSGGGICLKKIADNAKDIPQYIRNVLIAPHAQISLNAGYEIKENKSIKDPAMVVKTAVTNAFSIAGIILTYGSIITLNKEQKHENIQRMPGM